MRVNPGESYADLIDHETEHHDRRESRIADLEQIARERCEFEALNPEVQPSPILLDIDDSPIVQQIMLEAMRESRNIAAPEAAALVIGNKALTEADRLLRAYVEKNWRATAEAMVRS